MQSMLYWMSKITFYDTIFLYSMHDGPILTGVVHVGLTSIVEVEYFSICEPIIEPTRMSFINAFFALFGIR